MSFGSDRNGTGSRNAGSRNGVRENSKPTHQTKEEVLSGGRLEEEEKLEPTSNYSHNQPAYPSKLDEAYEFR